MALKDIWIDKVDGDKIDLNDTNLIANELIDTQEDLVETKNNIPTKNSQLENDSDFATKNYVDSAKDEAIAEIPKKVSQLSNDKEYTTREEVDSIAQEVEKKIPQKLSDLDKDTSFKVDESDLSTSLKDKVNTAYDNSKNAVETLPKKENTANKTEEILKTATHTQYPTAKASYEAIEKAKNTAMDSIQETQDTIYETLPNMFNKDDERIIPKKYIQGFKFVNASLSSCTHPIPVKEGIRYKFMSKGKYIGSAINNIVYCDEQGNFEFKEDGVTFLNTQYGTYPEDMSYVEFTAKQTGFVVVNMCNFAYDVFVFAEAERYTTEFTLYGIQSKLLTPMELLIGTPTEELIQLLKNALGASPLTGKKATFNGDSICAGAGFTGGYGKIITDKFGMTYQNIAVGGGTITSGNVTDSGSTRHCICDTIVNMDSDSDYAIVEGGCNDAMISAPLGAITNGYDAELDTTTFYGAFEKMCKELVTRFAGKKIGYILTHKAGAKFNSNDTTSGYYDAALKCCAKWGVPVCNLNIEVPPLTYIPALEEAYTNNGDGTHPNEAGYNAYYVPKIIAFMERL